MRKIKLESFLISNFRYSKKTIYTKKELLFNKFKLENVSLELTQKEEITLRFKVKNINDFDWPENIELKGTNNCPYQNGICYNISPLKINESRFYSIDIFYPDDATENYLELIFFAFDDENNIKYFSKKIKIIFKKIENEFKIEKVELI